LECSTGKIESTPHKVCQSSSFDGPSNYSNAGNKPLNNNESCHGKVLSDSWVKVDTNKSTGPSITSVIFADQSQSTPGSQKV